MDVCRVRIIVIRLELLLLFVGRVYVPIDRRASCSGHDDVMCRCIFVYVQYVNECMLRLDDRDRYD